MLSPTVFLRYDTCCDPHGHVSRSRVLLVKRIPSCLLPYWQSCHGRLALFNDCKLHGKISKIKSHNNYVGIRLSTVSYKGIIYKKRLTAVFITWCDENKYCELSVTCRVCMSLWRLTYSEVRFWAGSARYDWLRIITCVSCKMFFSGPFHFFLT